MSKAQGRVLIVEDDEDIAQALVRLVGGEGLTPLLAKNGRDALQMVRAGDIDVLMTDFRMPEMDGIELMRKAMEIDPELPVILMTGFADVRGAVEAIRAGAHDYLAKPFDHHEIIRVLLRALRERQLKMELKNLVNHVHHTATLRETFGPSELVGKLIFAVERVANSNFSVVILGETGSGKEVVARAIHSASPRARGPFIPVDCGAIPEALIESELFGYERGAFTGADHQKVGKFEAARGGTLFLDEISNMTLAAQAKLLRVLQEKTVYRLGSTKSISVDTRVLAASNQNLEKLSEDNLFRSDLYFRLNDFTISVPALRQRSEDMLYLAKRFMDFTNIELSKSVKSLSLPAVEAMLAYNWPGNVRQLQSVIRRAVLLAENIITEEHLSLGKKDEPAAANGLTESSFHNLAQLKGMPLREILRRITTQLEREVIAQTLQRTGGNKAEAARLLHVDYKTLHTKVKEYAIQIIHTEEKQPHD